LTGQVTLVKSGLVTAPHRYPRVANFVAADGDKSQKVSGTASDGEFWVSKALSTIEALEKDTKHVTLLEVIDKDDKLIRTSARHAVDNLKQVPANQEEAAKGAELLLLGSVLYQYSADEEDIDTDTLEVRIVSAAFENLDTDDLPGLRRGHDSYVCF
jgi:hypothetical protein